MVRITEDLIRRRSEHNECVISTLEELSLHQQDIERIEYLDKWCRDLKILYLQSNLIPRIENVGRLKKLEYLNLALNNIEKIENVEDCESLSKLDLTVNFVGELTSVETLRNLCHFRELYLTGNPCCEYEGYREYVIATLPRLQTLDGIEIEKSERILALQKLHEVQPQILIQQRKYLAKREVEKASEKENNGTNTNDATNSNSSGDVNEEDEEEKERRFWNEPAAYTPESRLKVHQHMEEERLKRENKNKPPQTEKPERRLQTDDGQMLNINDAKVDFTLTEDEEGKNILLDVSVFRFMDTDLCDADVQPTYVRITIKGKILQIVLPEEVHPMESRAQRSLTTGHLLITMPKVKQVLKARAAKQSVNSANSKSAVKEKKTVDTDKSSRETLEVNLVNDKSVDFANIVSETSVNGNTKSGQSARQRPGRQAAVERPNSEGFVDDPDVPPLL